MTHPYRLVYRCAALGMGLLASACAVVPSQTPPRMDTSDVAPPAWNTPLPHAGNTTDLAQWWQSLGDPLLVELIDSAEKVSPTLASATSRLRQARATLASADAANRPGLSASASAQRGVSLSSPTVGTALQSSLDASWEIDLFGANSQAASAAQARLAGSGAQWHEARVSVAAETASAYFNGRTCRQLLEVMQADASSRSETSRLSTLSAQAGFTAPAMAALAQASAAEGSARVTQQRNQCDSAVKALVYLTAMDEPALRQRLDAPAPLRTAPGLPAVSAVPAKVLAQRPDVFAAQNEVAAASADLGSAQAQRYPRLVLNGSVGSLNYTTQGSTTDLSTWSIGPVSLSLPILDGGRRAANVQAAEARYDEATALYRAKVRQAVREVEDALLSLTSTASQKEDASTAARSYGAAFSGTQARFQAGSTSLPELEEARRTALAAQTSLLQLDLQHTMAWIALYRALGGGWSLNAALPNTPHE